MSTFDLLTRLAEVARDPPGTPEHAAPEWLIYLCGAGLVAVTGNAEHNGEGWIEGRAEYRITATGEFALAAWELHPAISHPDTGEDYRPGCACHEVSLWKCTHLVPTEV